MAISGEETRAGRGLDPVQGEAGHGALGVADLGHILYKYMYTLYPYFLIYRESKIY